MIQKHPSKSFAPNLNFWEEFPDFKIHRIFGDFWRNNKKANQLKLSSLYMWALALCYDRVSTLYAQPEVDKWQLVSEELFGDPEFMRKLAEDPESSDLIFTLAGSPMQMISAFEECIDTPLGLSLRRLEKKLEDRTRFMEGLEYSLDYYEEKNGRSILVKGTADQLDKMLINTDKIASQIKKIMDDLKVSEDIGESKGGGEASLTDGDNTF